MTESMESSGTEPSEFTEAVAHELIARLRERGMAFDAGLSDCEAAEIEEILTTPIRPDLKILMRAAIPESVRKWQLIGWQEDGYFPYWRKDTRHSIAMANAWLYKSTAFDVEHGFRTKQFGPKPDTSHDAIEHAIETIRRYPRMIRMWGHRFMPMHPGGSGNLVVSMHGPGDTIIYGRDLVTYWCKKFWISMPNWIPAPRKSIEQWESLFDLSGWAESSIAGSLRAEPNPPFNHISV